MMQIAAKRQTSNENRIFIAAPDLSGNEENYVVDAIRSSWISSTGEYLDRFEQEFAARVNAKHVLAVSNGTVALHLALLGLGIGPGDEVIVPSLTYIATANAVLYVGAEPVFADVDPNTWCIDPKSVEACITPRTRAIIPVDLYGHPADMDAINAIAAAHGLKVIEDAAEAFTATYKTRPAGGLGDIGTFSFYGNKILTSGEGGAVVVNDDELYRRLKMIRGQGMDPDRRYYFPIVGHNFRLTNLAAALLCAQLERSQEIVAKRRWIYRLYTDALAGIPGIALQPAAPGVTIAPWLFCITVDEKRFGLSRDGLMDQLGEAGVETRPFFIPIHSLPPYRRFAARVKLTNTDQIAAAGLNLPTHSSLTAGDIERITGLIKACRRPSWPEELVA